MTNTNKNEKVVKVTKRDRFNQLLAISEVANNEALVEFINHEIELLTRKNSSDKKPTKEQIKNQETAEIVLQVLKDNDKPMTVTEIIKTSVELSDYTNQKVTALLRTLISADKVERIEDKRKTYFKAK